MADITKTPKMARPGLGILAEKIAKEKEEKKKKKNSKISKKNFKRDRSPMEVNRVMSKLKSDAQAMGGDIKSMGELKPLKGESIESFKSRPSTKLAKGGRAGYKGGGAAIKGVSKILR